MCCRHLGEQKAEVGFITVKIDLLREHDFTHCVMTTLPCMNTVGVLRMMVGDYIEHAHHAKIPRPSLELFHDVDADFQCDDSMLLCEVPWRWPPQSWVTFQTDPTMPDLSLPTPQRMLMDVANDTDDRIDDLESVTEDEPEAADPYEGMSCPTCPVDLEESEDGF